MVVIRNYDSFNFRRYSNPWVARVDSNGRIDFAVKVGGYTGAYGKGEEGSLYITNPVENAVYAYGQKDYRGHNGGYKYIQYKNGEFNVIAKTELIAVLSE